MKKLIIITLILAGCSEESVRRTNTTDLNGIEIAKKDFDNTKLPDGTEIFECRNANEWRDKLKEKVPAFMVADNGAKLYNVYTIQQFEDKRFRILSVHDYSLFKGQEYKAEFNENGFISDGRLIRNDIIAYWLDPSTPLYQNDGGIYTTGGSTSVGLSIRLVKK